MVSYGTGRELYAVTYDIVLISEDLLGVLCVKSLESALGHGERIVCEDVLLRLLVILIHREIIYIAETVSVLLDEVESCAELISDPSR